LLKKAVLTISLLMASIGVASGATVGFEALPLGKLSAGSSYTEAGFTFTTVSGGSFGGGDSRFIGIPGTPFWIGFEVAPIIGDTVSITNAGGSQFRLESVDYARLTASGSASDQVKFVGLLAGSVIETSLLLSALDGKFNLFNLGFTGFFDEVQMVVTGSGSTSLLLDNMRFEVAPIPLPAGALLLISALGVLVLARRRAVL
jgi:hypothetical protein